MKMKLIKKLILSCDRCTTEVLVHTNTSDEWEDVLLFSADSIEGKVYGQSALRKSYFTLVGGRIYHNEYGNYTPDLEEFQHSQMGFGYKGDMIDLDPMCDRFEDPENFKKYAGHELKVEFDVGDDLRQVILHIAPHDHVMIRSDVMEVYEFVEDDHKALYDKWALPTVSYKLLGDTVTLHDDRVACHIELTVSRMFEKGDDVKPDFNEKFFAEFEKVTVKELYQYDVKKQGITQEDVERVKSMMQWWNIDKSAGKIVWIKIGRASCRE